MKHFARSVGSRYQKKELLLNLPQSIASNAPYYSQLKKGQLRKVGGHEKTGEETGRLGKRRTLRVINYRMSSILPYWQIKIDFLLEA